MLYSCTQMPTVGVKGLRSVHILTVNKCLHETVGVLKHVEGDQQLRNAIVGKRSDRVDVVERTVASSSTAGPHICHEDLCSFV